MRLIGFECRVKNDENAAYLSKTLGYSLGILLNVTKIDMSFSIIEDCKVLQVRYCLPKSMTIVLVLCSNLTKSEIH